MEHRDRLMSVIDRTDVAQGPLQPPLEKSGPWPGLTSIE